MNATELLKHKEVKKFLLEAFPKPILDRKEIFPEISTLENKNPSLTGNSFEFFLRILNTPTHLKIGNEFEEEINTALKNIKRIQKLTNTRIAFKDHIKIYLSDKEYEKKLAIIRRILINNHVSIKEVSKKFKYSIIENIENLEVSFKIIEKTDLVLADILHSFGFGGMWKDMKPDTILVDKNSLYNYLKYFIETFEDKCTVFVQKKMLDKEFVNLLLEFTQISSQFYSNIDVVKGLHFEQAYVDYVFNLFKIIYEKNDFQKKKLLCKPSLRSLGILATPDFLVDDRILEIKTSKYFFSTEDYLQGLIYIILAQQKQNKKRWGVIREIEIFYPVFNKSIKLKLKENDNRIKPALNFLKEYSTDEPKRKLKRLKERMVKERKNKKRK